MRKLAYSVCALALGRGSRAGGGESGVTWEGGLSIVRFVSDAIFNNIDSLTAFNCLLELEEYMCFIFSLTSLFLSRLSSMNLKETLC